VVSLSLSLSRLALSLSLSRLASRALASRALASRALASRALASRVCVRARCSSPAVRLVAVYVVRVARGPADCAEILCLPRCWRRSWAIVCAQACIDTQEWLPPRDLGHLCAPGRAVLSKIHPGGDERTRSALWRRDLEHRSSQAILDAAFGGMRCLPSRRWGRRSRTRRPPCVWHAAVWSGAWCRLPPGRRRPARGVAVRQVVPWVWRVVAWSGRWCRGSGAWWRGPVDGAVGLARGVVVWHVASSPAVAPSSGAWRRHPARGAVVRRVAPAFWASTHRVCRCHGGRGMARRGGSGCAYRTAAALECGLDGDLEIVADLPGEWSARPAGPSPRGGGRCDPGAEWRTVDQRLACPHFSTEAGT
jgi:hypothetical protein